jgi:hypothetical protein
MIPTRAIPLVAALTLAACGGGDDSAGDTTQAQRARTTPPASGAPTPKAAKPKKDRNARRAPANDVAVITAWADTLRAGHVREAARYFDLPAIVQNAGPAVRLRTKKAVLAFNTTLPCGAHVVRTVAGDRYTVAIFVLTERPGSPGCGATGELAATAFVLHHGKISEWRRVLVPPPLGPEENVEPAGPLI